MVIANFLVSWEDYKKNKRKEKEKRQQPYLRNMSAWLKSGFNSKGI